jgi:hypothetical protein
MAVALDRGAAGHPGCRVLGSCTPIALLDDRVEEDHRGRSTPQFFPYRGRNIEIEVGAVARNLG